MSEPRDDYPLTTDERHLIALLRQGPQAPQRLAETLGLTLEQTLHVLQRLDRTVERGYAGFSLWDWHKLPDYLAPRYTDYARANASIGINGTVSNFSPRPAERSWSNE
jgi:alpha-glucuronidase